MVPSGLGEQEKVPGHPGLDLPSWRGDLCTCRQECSSSFNSAAPQTQPDCDKENRCSQLE